MIEASPINLSNTKPKQPNRFGSSHSAQTGSMTER